MARFIGTIDDYEKYIGPRIRNIVNTLAKNERNKRDGICEFCKKKAELQSAHKQGKGRKALIYEALKKYNNGSYIDVDVKNCENEILELHKPINQIFYFLCMECHRKYDSKSNEIENIEIRHDEISYESYSMENDSKNKLIQNIVEKETNSNGSLIRKEIQKIKSRIGGWFNNKEQINSKILYAFIKSYNKFNGNVNIHNLRIESNVSTFDNNFNQMKTFGERNHGKIFDQRDDYVFLWKPVEEIVWENYNKYHKWENGT